MRPGRVVLAFFVTVPINMAMNDEINSYRYSRISPSLEVYKFTLGKWDNLIVHFVTLADCALRNAILPSYAKKFSSRNSPNAI